MATAKCEVCSKEYEVKPYRLGKTRFCGMACRAKVILNTPEVNLKKGLKKEKNNNWNGGRTVHTNGYILVRAVEHPNCNSRGYMYEHRLVMEKKLKRYLLPTEQVHHINEDRTDNHIDNLELMSLSEHSRFHGVKRGGINKPSPDLL